MSFNLSAIAVRERAVTLFFIVTLAAAGVYAFLMLGPFVNDEYSDVSFALYALKAKGMPMRELARQAEVIRQDLLHVPGVKKINILGERPEQIFVEFSYAKLATLGVSARDIFSALQRQNTVTPAGSVDTKGPRLFIRIDGAYDSVQAI